MRMTTKVVRQNLPNCGIELQPNEIIATWIITQGSAPKTLRWHLYVVCCQHTQSRAFVHCYR